MWLCPSLSRPKNIARLAEVWERTAKGVPLVVTLANDDPKLDEYSYLPWPEGWDIHVIPRMFVQGIWQWFYTHYPYASSYGFIGDDVVPETEDWTEKLETAAGDWMLAYPHDSIHGGNLCPHFCAGGEFIRSIGWLGNPALRHSFLDTSLWALSEIVGNRAYVPEVKFNHMHPISQKAEHDDVYQIIVDNYEHDQYFFRRWCLSHQTQKLSRKVRDEFRARGVCRDSNTA